MSDDGPRRIRLATATNRDEVINEWRRSDDILELDDCTIDRRLFDHLTTVTDGRRRVERLNFDGAQFRDTDDSFRNADFVDEVSFRQTNFGNRNGDFGGATFGDGNVNFGGAIFGDGNVNFGGAIFGDGGVNFAGASFGDGGVYFGGVTFGDGTVDFGGVAFGDGTVNFAGASFGDGTVDFGWASFGDGSVNFAGVAFGDGTVNFAGVTFGDGTVNFGEAIFRGRNVDFSYAAFGDGNVSFAGVIFGDGTVRFSRATFGDGNVDFSSAAFGDGNVDFDGVSFRKPLRISVRDLSLNGSHLQAGGLVMARGKADFTRLTIEKPVRLQGATQGVPMGDEGPQLTSLDEAWLLAPVTIADNISLKTCTLTGTIGLDRLRITGRPFEHDRGRQRIAQDPMSDQHVAWAERRWKDWLRLILRRSHKSGSQRIAQDPDGLSDHALGSTYRQIRFALETSGNAAGANEFYEGEMAARQRAAWVEKRWPEWFLLWTYWAVSRYSLSVVRPVFWLAVLTGLGTAGFLAGRGFAPFGDGVPLSNSESFVFALESATSFLRPPGQYESMTISEELVQAALRILGPILIALAFLSVRNRVKR